MSDKELWDLLQEWIDMKPHKLTEIVGHDEETSHPLNYEGELRQRSRKLLAKLYGESGRKRPADVQPHGGASPVNASGDGQKNTGEAGSIPDDSPLILAEAQDRIREELMEMTANACEIDGSGCDSGDPVDLTISEIRQAVNYLKDEICRQAIVGGRIARTAYLRGLTTQEGEKAIRNHLRLKGLLP